MSGENGHAAAPTEGAPPTVETKEDSTASAPAEAQKEGAAAENKAAPVSEGTTAPAPAAAEAAEGSDEAGKGKQRRPQGMTIFAHVEAESVLLIPFGFASYSCCRKICRAG